MLLNRFIRVKIWSANGGSVEYDNKVDTTWGISAGSINLNKVLCPSELSFGDCNSALLELQIFGLTGVELNGRKIQLMVEDTVQEDKYLATETDDPIVTEDNISLHGGFSSALETTSLFVGYIESSKTDYERTYRDIVAYDWLYYHKNDNVWEWLSAWWWDWRQSHSLQQPNLSDVTNAFLNMLVSDLELPNYDISPITNWLDFQPLFSGVPTPLLENYITVEQMMKYLFELQISCPYINGSGVLTFFQITSAISAVVDKSIPENKYEHENCTWEDYNVLRINHSRISLDGDLKYSAYRTSGNTVYHSYFDIVDNIFLYDIPATSTDPC